MAIVIDICCSGMQKVTVIVLNVSLVSCILVLFALLLLSCYRAPYLVIHVCFLLALAIGLLLLVNWWGHQSLASMNVTSSGSGTSFLAVFTGACQNILLHLLHVCL